MSDKYSQGYYSCKHVFKQGLISIHKNCNSFKQSFKKFVKSK